MSLLPTVRTGSRSLLSRGPRSPRTGTSEPDRAPRRNVISQVYCSIRGIIPVTCSAVSASPRPPIRIPLNVPSASKSWFEQGNPGKDAGVFPRCGCSLRNLSVASPAMGGNLRIASQLPYRAYPNHSARMGLPVSPVGDGAESPQSNPAPSSSSSPFSAMRIRPSRRTPIPSTYRVCRNCPARTNAPFSTRSDKSRVAVAGDAPVMVV